MSEPKWITRAKSYLGTAEIPGPKTAPLITKWLAALKAPFRDDETAWCGSFVGAMMEESDLPFVADPWGSRNWLKYGVSVSGPCVGAIVVFWRGSPSGWSGHVGFVVGRDQHGNIMVLAGNQGNKVSIEPFAASGPNCRILSYRYPSGQLVSTVGFNALPVISSNGVLSTNEA